MRKEGSVLRERIRRQWCGRNFRQLARLALVSLVFSAVIECFARRSLDDTLRFIFMRPLAFLYGALILYFFLSISLLTRKRMFWFSLLATVCVGIAVADFILLTYRSMPLTASDILLMGSVRDIFEKYLSHAWLAVMMLSISAVLGAIIDLWMRTGKSESMLTLGAANLFAAGLLLLVAGTALVHGGYLRRTEEYGNLPEAYSDSGFIYSFAASSVTRGVNEPEDYTPNKIDEVVQVRRELPPTGKETPNIIFVQLESFFDVNYMRTLQYETNPVPNFTALKRSCSTGLLSVPAIGAGTANTEFEVLTGMNLNHFGVGEYPYMTTVSSDAVPSVVSVLAGVGYSTHAIHNNNATFYDRHLVYSNLGFDSFTSLEYMPNVEYNPLGWADDSVLVPAVLDALEATRGRDLVFTVSVQPHGRYPKKPLEGAPTMAVSGMDDEERAYGFSYYLEQLRQCDEFIGELTAALKDWPEPVVVVFYGDHLPSFNITNAELSRGNMQTTEYVIWSNYSMKKVDRDLQTYQLAAYVMERCRIHEGAIFCLHQSCGYAADDEASYQNDLKLLEYDLLDGEGYAAPVKNHHTMRFGVRDVTIVSAVAENGMLTLTGENFTPFSVVYKNDEALETELVGGALVVEDIPEKGDRYFVAQVSAADPLDILSRSRSLYWEEEHHGAVRRDYPQLQ